MAAMLHSLLFASVIFATFMFITPGPTNLLLLSSGLTYGFRPTIAHILGITLGITLGFAFMIGAVGVGLGTIFIACPVLQTILKYSAVAYLVYLAVAVAIAMSGPVSTDRDAGRRPMTFWGAAMFQWVNIKGWVMVIGTITAYAAIASYPWNIAIQVGLSLLLGAVFCTAWALYGSALRLILTSPKAVRGFNVVKAILLPACLCPVFMDAWCRTAPCEIRVSPEVKKL
jgi:threonine/homoserine/homoserine lactone efflux protein